MFKYNGSNYWNFPVGIHHTTIPTRSSRVMIKYRSLLIFYHATKIPFAGS